MTTLTIIPNYDRKRLKSVGTVAAGEHVEVTILGGADWIQPNPDVLDDSQTLRLRLIFGGKTVAVFPYWTETHEDDLGNSIGPDRWDESQSGEDAVCEINLNTIPAEKMLRLGGQCLWVLDDPTNHILYGTGEVQIGAWPRRRGTDTPYDLDGYPDFVEYAKAAVQAAQTAIESAVDTATGIVATATSAASTATSAATTAGTYANTAGSRMAAAENARDAAALSATAAGNAQAAAETAQGKAEDAQAAAETAQEKAEAWATGGTGGTPGATNNAKYWAEQAAETLEDKADKVEDATEGNFTALDDEGNLTDSGKAASDFAASEHSHAMSEVTGLSDALDAKGSAETLTNVANKVTTLIGNAIGDDARSVREIAALAIAAWAAGADARYDTLKEIADWILNDTTGAAKMASDIATLAATKVDKASGYGLSKNDFTDERRDKLAGIAANANNYTLPAASVSMLGGVKVGNNLSIDANGVLSAMGGSSVAVIPPSTDPAASGKAADAKATGDALVGKRGLYDLSYARNWRVRTTVQAGQAIYTLKPWPEDLMQPAWRWDRASAEAEPDFKWFTLELHNNVWTFKIKYGDDSGATVQWQGDINTAEMQFSVSEYEQLDRDYTVQRSSANSDSLALVSDVPTKTSQLTNDGPSSGPNVGHPFATTNQIPAPIDISGKLDGAAAYPAWEDDAYTEGYIVSYKGKLYRAKEDVYSGDAPPDVNAAWSETNLDWLKQDALSSAQIGYINAVPNKANSADVATALAQKASLADLPYRLVEPGKWSYLPEVQLTDFAVTVSPEYSGGVWEVSYYSVESGNETLQMGGDADDLSLDFATFIATRPSLPGHLLDRAGNLVVVTGDTTLTLPAAVPGYIRDFLVRLEISGSTVPTITFAAPTGETITYETDGDEFPVPDEAGTWSYSFTENCVAHTFAVSLKKVNVVAQGGS